MSERYFGNDRPWEDSGYCFAGDRWKHWVWDGDVWIPEHYEIARVSECDGSADTFGLLQGYKASEKGEEDD